MDSDDNLLPYVTSNVNNQTKGGGVDLLHLEVHRVFLFGFVFRLFF